MDMFEDYCNEPTRMRGRAGTMACGFGLLRGTKPPYIARGAAVCSMAGAPADTPPADSEG